MKEQKKIIRYSLIFGLLSILIALILEFKIDKWIVAMSCSHRDFAINVFIGVFSGAVLSFLTSLIIYNQQKSKILHQDIINLIEICESYKQFFDRFNINTSIEKEDKLFRLELIDALYKSIQKRDIYIENEFSFTKQICHKNQGQYLTHAKLLCDNLRPITKKFREDYTSYCNGKISIENIIEITKGYIKDAFQFNEDIDNCIEWAKIVESEI